MGKYRLVHTFYLSSSSLVCFFFLVAILFFTRGVSSLGLFLFIGLLFFTLGTSSFLGLAFLFKFFFRSTMTSWGSPFCKTVTFTFFLGFFFFGDFFFLGGSGSFSGEPRWQDPRNQRRKKMGIHYGDHKGSYLHYIGNKSISSTELLIYPNRAKGLR